MANVGLKIIVKTTRKDLQVDQRRGKPSDNSVTNYLFGSRKVYQYQLLGVAKKIQRGIKDNIVNRKDIYGRPQIPISYGWAKYKGHDNILIWTAQLIRSIKVRKAGNSYEVFVENNRRRDPPPRNAVKRKRGKKIPLTNAELAEIIQVKGSGRKRLRRKFFGLPKKKIQEILKSEIKFKK